jgi:WD40 repeat protein
MAVAEAEAPSLFGLIGRQWAAAAAVESCAFDASGAAVAFALANGSVGIAPMEDVESTTSRYRVSVENGRATISPRAKPVPPMLQVPVGEAPVCVAAFGASGFLAGSACGRLVRITPTGFLLPITGGHDGPVAAIVTLADGSALVAAGSTVARYPADGGPPRMLVETGAAITCLAATGDGRCIAVATAAALTLRTAADTPNAAELFIALAEISHLTWSPDGAHLAAALGTGGVALVEGDTGAMVRHADYPAPVRSLAWSLDGRRLVTSGAFRVIVWPVEEPTEPGPDAGRRSIETGRASLVAVQAVDIRNSGSLVAVGYETGMVLVTEIGRRDELLVKGSGDGAIRDVRWSQDGRHLAFGTDTGAVALVEFPPHLFK